MMYGCYRGGQIEHFAEEQDSAAVNPGGRLATRKNNDSARGVLYRWVDKEKKDCTALWLRVEEDRRVQGRRDGTTWWEGIISCTYVHGPKTRSAVRRAGRLCSCKPEMECNSWGSANPARAPETNRSLFTHRVRLNGFTGPDLLASVFWHRKAASEAPGLGRPNT